MGTTLLSKAKIHTALDFYSTASIIPWPTTAAREEAANKALRNKYTDVDVNYLLEEFEHAVFYYHAEEYGIAFMQGESAYSYALEQLVFDLVGFTAQRFLPEPLTIMFDPECNGTMSFVQGGVRYERELFGKGDLFHNLLQLLNEAIVAKSGEVVFLAPLGISDGETQAVVLLSAEHLQIAQQMGMIVSWYRSR